MQANRRSLLALGKAALPATSPPGNLPSLGAMAAETKTLGLLPQVHAGRRLGKPRDNPYCVFQVGDIYVQAIPMPRLLAYAAINDVVPKRLTSRMIS